MADGEGWMVAGSKKKDRRDRRAQHKYISETTAMKLQRDLDITGLAAVLLSTESRNLQEDGWLFDGIVKNDESADQQEDPENTDSTEYISLPIPNKWGDRALFSRKVESQL